jgi:hypothetical protein
VQFCVVTLPYLLGISWQNIPPLEPLHDLLFNLSIVFPLCFLQLIFLKLNWLTLYIEERLIFLALHLLFIAFGNVGFVVKWSKSVVGLSGTVVEGKTIVGLEVHIIKKIKINVIIWKFLQKHFC